MGSFFAGVKAGTLAGIVYMGGMGAFNAALLYALKPEVLSAISAAYPQVCGAAGGSNATALAVEDCFSSVVVVYVPLLAFLGFFVAMICSAVFGAVYESIPGRTPAARGTILGIAVGFSLVMLNLVGIYFDPTAKIATVACFLGLTFTYGVLMGKLYRRYTRQVEFVSRDGGALKILVDGHDFTGKARTFAARSSHTVRAEPGEGAEFKEWAASGGVHLEDPRSFETTMDVEGDGVLSAKAARKA